MVPEGVYMIQIESVEDGKSQNQDPMISIKLEITDGPEEGSFLFDRILLSENPNSPGWKIRWRAKQFLKAIGEPHHGDSFDWDSGRWPYKKCLVKVGHEKEKNGKYAGQVFARIKAYESLETETKNGQKEVLEDPEIPF